MPGRCSLGKHSFVQPQHPSSHTRPPPPGRQLNRPVVLEALDRADSPGSRGGRVRGPPASVTLGAPQGSGPRITPGDGGPSPAEPGPVQPSQRHTLSSRSQVLRGAEAPSPGLPLGTVWRWDGSVVGAETQREEDGLGKAVLKLVCTWHSSGALKTSVSPMPWAMRRGDHTAPLSERPRETTSVSEDVEERGPLRTAGGTVNWQGHRRKQGGGDYHRTQQCHFINMQSGAKAGL